MTPEHRSLLMRANRLLGGALVEHNLVKLDDLEKANERLLEVVAGNQPRQATVLGLLCFESKVLNEEDVLHHVIETSGIGLVDLRSYDTPDDAKKDLDLGACWATWSVPFDREEEFTYIATAYYLSSAVRTYWEKKCDGPIIWFGTTLEIIGDYLESLAAAPGPATGKSAAPFPAAAAAAKP